MVQYSNERLIEALQECKERHGQITTQTLNRDDSLPSGPIYSYRFDSLADAARKAGLSGEAEQLEENRNKRIGYSDEDIVEFLQDIADSDNTVSTRMIEMSDGPSASTVRNHIDSESIIGETIGTVEIVSHSEYTKKDKETVDEELLNIYDNDGTVLTKDLSSDTVTMGDLYRYYDSIRDARDELDIPHPEYDNYGTQSIIHSVKQPHTYIYVIRKNGELYVGKSEKPLRRLQQHKMDGDVSLERIVTIPENRDENDYEREVAMSVAREYNETNINGGQ